MKFLFLTNQASYHQMHFARAMAAELGEDNFRIVFAKATSSDRAEMGWHDDYDEPYIIRFSESSDAESECHKWIAEADVVIQGRFPIKHLRERIGSGKLTFACQERLWKKPPSLIRKITRFPHLYKNYYSVDRPNYHFLAIGTFAAKDLNDLGVFKNRSWRYGYFIDCPKSAESDQALEDTQLESEHLTLLWCARFSAVKQPHKALEIARNLKDGGLSIKLIMVGDGDLRQSIEAQASDMGLSPELRFTGWQSQSEVFEHMSNSDVFLMTSNHGEGWGLVVNEALSHGCAVVANALLGSAQSLVEHGKNGFLYSDDDLPSVTTDMLTIGAGGIRKIACNARASIADSWSAAEAARRTIALSDALLNGDENSASRLYATGLCSAV